MSVPPSYAFCAYSNNMSENLAIKLLQVQHILKKDPESYLSEYLTYFSFFKKIHSAHVYYPEKNNPELLCLLKFLGNVVPVYKKNVKEFTEILTRTLTDYSMNLNAEIRLEICQILTRFRKLCLIEPFELFKLYMNLFDCKDKSLRTNLYGLIISDFKAGQKKSHFTQDTKNKLQSLLFKNLSNSEQTLNVQNASLSILCELWRSNVWHDERSANAIAVGAFSPHFRVSYLSLMAIMGTYTKIKELDVSEDENELAEAADKITRETKRTRVHGTSHSNAKRKRKLQRTVEFLKKMEKKKAAGLPDLSNTAIIRFIYDPEEFTEKLLKRVGNAKFKYDYRLLCIEVISRVIAVHSLIVPNFYHSLLKYLKPHQEGVIRILTSIAQSSHELVPPEYITPVIETISDNFVSLHNAAEICSVGINSIREICARAPNAIDSIIANDLILYAKDRKVEKAVVSASRSLLQTLRAVNPSILLKKDRGKNAKIDSNLDFKPYGGVEIHSTVPGSYLLKNENESCSDDNDYGSYEEESESDNSSWASVEELDTEQSITEYPQPSNIEEIDVCSTRLLTDEDFKKMRIMQKKEAMSKLLGSSRDDDNASGESDDEDCEDDSILVPAKIGTVFGIKNPSDRFSKKTVDDKKENIKKYNPHKGWRFNPKASSTNLEKKKSKPFLMSRQKYAVRQKKTRSFQQRVQSFKKAIEKKKKAKA